MKVVCICEDEASVRCVTSGLVPDHEISLVIVPDFDAPRSAKSWKKAVKKKLFSKVINKLFFSVFSRKASRNLVSEEIKRHGVENLDFSNLCANIVKVPFFQINSKSTAELIASHQPDILFVCGAPILKRYLFEIPKHGAVNFHYGYSPKYKGQHTLLWAYNRGDHDSLGGTFLRIDKGVDTGCPLSFVFPKIDSADTLETIEAKLAVLARKHVSQALESAAEGQHLEAECSEALAQQFVIRHADYGPVHHLIYHVQLLRNRFFRGGMSLRDEQIKVA